MQCQHIMRRDVHAVAENDDVLLAARIMRDNDVGFLPVCDETGRVIGVLTDRDLVLRACAEDSRPSATAVGAVLTRGAIFCLPTHSVSRAEQLMRRHRVSRVIVMDEQDRPVGILSLSDIAQYERASRVGRTIRTIAERKYAPERP